MFGKHFASMYTGSLFGKPALVFAVWGYVIANQRPRRNGSCTVELNPVLLAPMFKTSHAEVREAIDVLMAPDPISRSAEHDGRRLLHEGGVLDGPATYQVVNGPKYRAIRDEEERREQVRTAVAKHRASKKANSNQGNQSKPREAQAEGEGDSDREGAGAPGQAVEVDPARHVTAHCAYRAWNAALQAAGHAYQFPEKPMLDAWQAIADACNAKGKPQLALDDLCSWLWTAPEGPVKAGRVKPALMTPKRLVASVNADVERAGEWMSARENAAQ